MKNCKNTMKKKNGTQIMCQLKTNVIHFVNPKEFNEPKKIYYNHIQETSFGKTQILLVDVTLILLDFCKTGTLQDCEREILAERLRNFLKIAFLNKLLSCKDV